MSDTQIRQALEDLAAALEAAAGSLIDAGAVAVMLRGILADNPPFNQFPTPEEIRQMQTGRE